MTNGTQATAAAKALTVSAPVDAFIAALYRAYPKVAALLDFPELRAILGGWTGSTRVSTNGRTSHPTCLELYCFVGHAHVPLTIHGNFGVTGKDTAAFKNWLLDQQRMFLDGGTQPSPPSADVETLLAKAQTLRGEILGLDATINGAERSPTGSDYNDLYVIANCGLIDLLKALGDTTDFGD